MTEKQRKFPGHVRGCVCVACEDARTSPAVPTAEPARCEPGCGDTVGWGETARKWYCSEACRRLKPHLPAPESTPDVPGVFKMCAHPFTETNTFCGRDAGDGHTHWPELQPIPPRPEAQGPVTVEQVRAALAVLFMGKTSWEDDERKATVGRFIREAEARDKAQAERIKQDELEDGLNRTGIEQRDEMIERLRAEAAAYDVDVHRLRAELAAAKRFAETEYTRGYDLGKQSQTHAVAGTVETMLDWASNPGVRNVSISAELAAELAALKRAAPMETQTEDEKRASLPMSVKRMVDATAQAGGTLRERACPHAWGDCNRGGHSPNCNELVALLEQVDRAAEQRGRASRDGVVKAEAWRGVDGPMRTVVLNRFSVEADNGWSVGEVKAFEAAARALESLAKDGDK